MKGKTASVVILLGLLLASTFLSLAASVASEVGQLYCGTQSSGHGSFTDSPKSGADSQLYPTQAENKIYRSKFFGAFNGSSKNQNRVEIVIGVNEAQSNIYGRISEHILKGNGEIVNTVSIGGETRAIVANMPYDAISNILYEVETSGFSCYIESNTKYRIDLIPNDYEWPKQWWLRKIQADYAWNLTTGKPSVVIAVIDTGIDWDHPDLAANVWRNVDEVVDGVDNDGNGFVDDVRGWDFVDTSDPVWAGEDGTVKDNDPMDFHGHGTHCAGIAAAVGNNSAGVVGVTWNCKIMPVRAGYKGADGYGYLEYDDAAQAIIYAAENGADIISMSWGSYQQSEVIYDALKYAFESGVLLIAAAGNEATSLESYPAAYEEVVAVSATTEDDDPSWWTNFGNWIAVAAPGVDIYSTVWDNSYTYMDGTSMSTPSVAGVAALIWSRFQGMTRDQVRAQLQFTADDLGTPGFDARYGYGRVNASRAVTNGPSEHDVLILNLKASPIVRPGEVAVIDVTMLNMGLSEEADVNTRLIVDGIAIQSETTSFLAKGESIELKFLWDTTGFKEDTYNVTCYIVPVQSEVSTQNNVWSTSIWVRLPKVIRVPNDHNTIQAAIDAAIEGDTVSVASGEYYEHVVISKNKLRLIGEETGSTIIDGQKASDVILVAADDVEIKGFTVRGSSRNLEYYPPFSGIFLSRSSNCTIMDTRTVDNLAGMFLFRSTGNILRCNSMNDNRYNFGIDGYVLSDFVHDVDESNTVDGKPICYLVGEHNRIAPLDSGCVVAVNSTNIVARNLNLTKNYANVLLAFTVNSLVENVKTSNGHIGVHIIYSSFNAICTTNIVRNDIGAYLYGSNANYFSHNMILSCLYGFRLDNSPSNKINFNEFTSNRRGVFAHESSETTLLANEFQKNAVSAWLYRSDKNNIEFNEISYSVCGIMLTQSQGNTICRNNVFDNFFALGTFCYGMWLEWSSDNDIYHNNFVNNQFHVHSVESINAWDKGYPIGGNYWSGYYGADSNNDGIGDTPYTIDGNNQDHYPLMNPHAPTQIIAMHDAAVVSVTPSPFEVYAGQSVRITVVVANEGNTTESFNIIAKYELEGVDYLIGMQTADTLAPGANVTLTFIWITRVLGVAAVRADIPKIQNETDTTDNTRTSLIRVKVKMLGDVNNDNRVDIHDIAEAARAFGTYFGHPRWNLQADLNQDGKVDIRDICLIAKNFGKTYT